MTNIDATSRFATVTREFCDWAEGPPVAGEIEMLIARRLLVCLTSLALELPNTECDDVERVEISHEAWTAMFKRFGELPVNYYGHCFDPLKVPADEATLGDLADDLADIWRDLKEGLMLWEAGHKNAAAFEWRESFTIHWGRHAAGALYPLHCWAQEFGVNVAPTQ
jgi:hypothetical protein